MERCPCRAEFPKITWHCKSFLVPIGSSLRQVGEKAVSGQVWSLISEVLLRVCTWILCQVYCGQMQRRLKVLSTKEFWTMSEKLVSCPAKNCAAEGGLVLKRSCNKPNATHTSTNTPANINACAFLVVRSSVERETDANVQWRHN